VPVLPEPMCSTRSSDPVGAAVSEGTAVAFKSLDKDRRTSSHVAWAPAGAGRLPVIVGAAPGTTKCEEQRTMKNISIAALDVREGERNRR